MEYTEAAQRRFKLAKEIIDVIQKKTNRTDEEWHAYTLKLDKYSPNPFIFEIYTMKKIRWFGKGPDKLLFDIMIDDNERTIKANNNSLIEFASGDKIPITYKGREWMMEFK